MGTPFPEMGRQLLWFFAQLLVFLIAIAYINFVYTVNILPDKLVNETFNVSDCLLVGKELTKKGKVFPRYRADFLLSYAAQNKTFQSIASGNGLDRAFTTDQAQQAEVLEQFNVGQVYPCWYNPDTPSIVVLVPRHSWFSTFSLVIPSIIALIMLFYLIRSIVASLVWWLSVRNNHQ